MSSGMIFVLMIIAMGIIGGILKARYGHRDHRDGERDDGETMRLKEEVRALKERLHVLERIAVEKENSLAREIDELRDRT